PTPVPLYSSSSIRFACFSVCLSTLLPLPCSTLFPYTTLFRSDRGDRRHARRFRRADDHGDDRHRRRLLGDRRSRDRDVVPRIPRSEEHTSELQSHLNLVCRLLLEKKKKIRTTHNTSQRRDETQ